MTNGSHPLTGTRNLPNVQVAFPGEHWSDCAASGAITPGEAIVPSGENALGQETWRTATAADSAKGAYVCMATRPIDIPDVNTGPTALGPNEIRNQVMADGEYVHRYRSGAFNLTLVLPGTYAAGDILGWDADGARPSGKSGAGSWRVSGGSTDIDDVLYVHAVHEYGDDDEVVLEVSFLNRGQF